MIALQKFNFYNLLHSRLLRMNLLYETSDICIINLSVVLALWLFPTNVLSSQILFSMMIPEEFNCTQAHSNFPAG
jgi:hypothetical protein